MHLYSRKVLIKENCDELIPSYLRFVKGVIDCEDLPLNISRETYQDSSLILKLRNVVTRRILKMLEDEMKRDSAKYDKWFADFSSFLKEGLMSDSENQESLLKLMRYHTNLDEHSLSLDDYVKKLKPHQKTIYFVTGNSREQALNSPFMEPFKGTDFPVLVLNLQIDEIIFQQIQTYKNYTFASVESSYEQILKDLGDVKRKDEPVASALPDEDVAPFSLWLKSELGSHVAKVAISKRIRNVPAVIFGQVSSSMRVVMAMMESSQGMTEVNRNNTLEINPEHPVIVKLNRLRKADAKKASTLAKIMLDNILMQSGIPYNIQESAKRNIEVMNEYVQKITSVQEGKRMIEEAKNH